MESEGGEKAEKGDYEGRMEREKETEGTTSRFI
jgi:hypothetical protein